MLLLRPFRFAVLAISCASIPAFAQNTPPTATENVLYTFPASGANQVHAELTQAWDGNFYGLTLAGDNGSTGAIVQATPAGVVTSVAELTSATGAAPLGGLVLAPDGSLYGTPTNGGASNNGSIIQYVPSTGALNLLYSFTGGTDGENPASTPVLGSDGSFYGTTYGVKNSTTLVGTIFRYTPGSGLQTLYNFCSQANCADGSQPGALLQASDGNFYGTTYGGGAGYGVVFQYAPSTNTYTVLYTFTGAADGGQPESQLTEGADGNLYGTTFLGGANGSGVVFEVNLGTLAVAPLASFAGNDSGGTAPLFLASDGNFYSVAEYGGSSATGSFYQYAPGGTVTDLWTFGTTDGDGAHPTAGVLQTANGLFYGTTYYGPFSDSGSGDGVLYNLALSGITNGPLQVSAPANGYVNQPQTVSFQANNAFSATMQQCYLYASSGANLTAFGRVSGTLTNGVYSGSTSFTPSAAGTYLVAVTCGGRETATATMNVSATAQTTTTVSAAPNPAYVGQNVTVSATVKPTSGNGVPTGTVTFSVYGQVLDTVTLVNGVASFTGSTSPYAPGSYPIIGKYSGDANNAASTSPAYVVTLNAVATTSTTVSVTPNPVIRPNNATITATVRSSNGTPTGTVTFRANGVVFATANVGPAGVASLTSSTGGFAAGQYSVTATYNGATGQKPSTSPALSVKVQ